MLPFRFLKERTLCSWFLERKCIDMLSRAEQPCSSVLCKESSLLDGQTRKVPFAIVINNLLKRDRLDKKSFVWSIFSLNLEFERISNTWATMLLQVVWLGKVNSRNKRTRRRRVSHQVYEVHELTLTNGSWEEPSNLTLPMLLLN